MNNLRKHINLTITYIISAVLLGACTENLPYHSHDPSKGNCQPPTGSLCTDSYYQEHEAFDLAFVEYTERGNAFDDHRVRKVLSQIAKKSEDTGVVLVTFVHGWTHNAANDDRDVVEFTKILKQLSGNPEDVLHGRRLVGVFVGWRGASIDMPYLELASFWERKAVAQEVGKGAVTEMLLELDRIDRTKPENVLVTIGHSFGGAIVLSALSEVLTQKIIGAEASTEVRGIGDGVILLNPAIEANQALSVVEAALNRDYVEGQEALLLTLSSDADKATHYAFPAGQTAGLLLTWRQAALNRDYFVDRDSQTTMPLREEDLDTAALGNFAPFLTHHLTLEQSNVPTASTSDELVSGALDLKFLRCEESGDGFAPKGWSKTAPNSMIKDIPENYPLYFVKTDSRFINAHSDIFNCDVVAFLTAVIDSRMRKAYGISDNSQESILQNSKKLSERFKYFRSAVLESQCNQSGG
jgi:pimeloyl-ACP methyl ester carboxylesterase